MSVQAGASLGPILLEVGAVKADRFASIIICNPLTFIVVQKLESYWVRIMLLVSILAAS